MTSTSPALSPDATREAVRAAYGAIATDGGSCCAPSCCTPTGGSTDLGYAADELAGLPEGTDLGLGCGNPLAIAGLQEGESVLDLGAGPGMDCLLAGQRVGPTGRVIGVDMTPAMVTRARANAATAGATNVSFRLGEIEALPVGDGSIDVILSNCVINLSPDKQAVAAEAFRVLRPGGRLAIRDVLSLQPLPDALASSVAALTGCVAGAASVDEMKAALSAAGFEAVVVTPDPRAAGIIDGWLPGMDASRYVTSAEVSARKPERAT